MICVGPFGRGMPAAAVPKPVDRCWQNVLIFLHLGQYRTTPAAGTAPNSGHGETCRIVPNQNTPLPLLKRHEYCCTSNTPSIRISARPHMTKKHRFNPVWGEHQTKGAIRTKPHPKNVQRPTCERTVFVGQGTVPASNPPKQSQSLIKHRSNIPPRTTNNSRLGGEWRPT